MNVYEVKVKGYKPNDRGVLAPCKLKLIVTGCATCGDAEKSAIEECSAFMHDEVIVTSVAQKSFYDMVNSSAARLWNVSVLITTIDTMQGKESKIRASLLVGADSAKEASMATINHMDGIDCEVVKVADSHVDSVL